MLRAKSESPLDISRTGSGEAVKPCPTWGIAQGDSLERWTVGALYQEPEVATSGAGRWASNHVASSEGEHARRRVEQARARSLRPAQQRALHWALHSGPYEHNN